MTKNRHHNSRNPYFIIVKKLNTREYRKLILNDISYNRIVKSKILVSFPKKNTFVNIKKKKNYRGFYFLLKGLAGNEVS
jgi:hypothetical protein